MIFFKRLIFSLQIIIYFNNLINKKISIKGKMYLQLILVLINNNKFILKINYGHKNVHPYENNHFG
jgi:hypothetical protein